MNKILLTLLFIPFLVRAQTAPPIVQGSKLYQFRNGIKIDSALFLPRRDTTNSDVTMLAPGMIQWNPATQRFNGRDSIKWVTFMTSLTGEVIDSAYRSNDTLFLRYASGGELPVRYPTKIVSNVDMLAAVPGDTGALVIVKENGRGGTFVWSATGTANGGTKFSGSNGIWNRIDTTTIGFYNVRWWGAKGDGVTNDSAAFHAAFSYVTGVGNGNYVVVPSGAYNIGSSFKLSGYRCGMVGAGAGSNPSNASRGTVIRATNQNAPVLDFTGYLAPANFYGKTIFKDFTIEGDNTPGVEKKGIYMAAGSSTIMSGISIRKTGGIPFDIGTVYFCTFSDIVIDTPVDCVPNDVPYMRLLGTNGCRFIGIGLRSIMSGPNYGPNGAIVILSNGVNPSHDNSFIACWVENLHAPADSRMWNITANTSVFADFQIFDTSKASGVTDTAVVFEFNPPAVSNFGGNIVRGVIPGRGTAAEAFDWGIRLNQSYNSINGVKGFRGNNIFISPGVGNTGIMLTGSQALAFDPAVIDSSGVTTNSYVDMIDGDVVQTIFNSTSVLIADIDSEYLNTNYTNKPLGYQVIFDNITDFSGHIVAIKKGLNEWVIIDAVGGEYLNNYYTKTESDARYINNQSAVARSENFHMQGAGYTQTNFSVYKTGSNSLNGYINLWPTTAGNRGASLQLSGDATPGLATWVHDGTGWFERMRILSNGNVGVGKTNPGSTLDVAGNGNFDGSLNIGGGLASITGLGNATVQQLTSIGQGTFGAAVLAPSLYSNGTLLQLGTSGGTFTGISIVDGPRVAINQASATSILDINGSLSLPIRTVTTDAGLLLSDYTLVCNNTAGTMNVTVPSASSTEGRVYVIKKISGAGNDVVITDATSTIDGNPTYTLTSAGNVVAIQSNGTAWYVIGH